MKFQQKIYLFACLVLIVIQYQCANIIPPSGGERDTNPPQLVKSSPANQSIRFNSKKVVLEFDEFFNLDNPLQNIVISPPMTNNPEFMISGKKLLISFKEDLQPDITYNINFGDAIKDFNEGNILANFSYVFATGAILDTYQVQGSVSSAVDNTPVKDVIVGLYMIPNDSAVYKSKPYYFSKTDKDGQFRINNIHEGSYQVVALKDENLDYLYNNGEWIGFEKDFRLNDSVTNFQLDLKVFKEKGQPVRLIDVVNKEAGVLQFVYNQAINNFSLDAAIYTKNDVVVISPTKDTITYYYTKYDARSATMYVKTNNTILDTIVKELFFIKEDEIDKNRVRFFSPVASSSKLAAKQLDTKQDYLKNYFFCFNRPVLLENIDLIDVVEDSVKIDSRNFSFSPDPKDNTRLKFQYALKPGSNYTVTFKAGALKDIFGFTNAELRRSFITYTAEDYGSIIINNKITSDKNYFLEVQDAAGLIIYKTAMSKASENKKLVLANYPAGTYRINVIEDANANKRWDTGNFGQKQFAERIFSINNNLVLKAGWDAEVDIKF